MANNLFLFAGLFMILRAGHSYILLTANIDDLHNLAAKVLNSPMTGAVQNVLRRAFDVVTDHLEKENDEKPREFNDNMRRAESELSVENDNDTDVDSKDSQNKNDTSKKTSKKDNNQERQASVYLKKIKNFLFENAEKTTKKSHDN